MQKIFNELVRDKRGVFDNKIFLISTGQDWFLDFLNTISIITIIFFVFDGGKH